MPRYVVAFFFDYQSYTCADKNKPMFYCFFVSGAWFIGHLLLRRRRPRIGFVFSFGALFRVLLFVHPLNGINYE